jgi:hypothetical protein
MKVFHLSRPIKIEKTPVAIDPIALVFSESVLQKLWEKLHPHVPSLTLQEAAKAATPEQRKAALAQAKMLKAYAEEAIAALS